MRVFPAALVALALGAQTYPPAYPRPGATRLFENEHVIVWDIAWLKGQPSPLHRHPYDLAGVYYASGDRLITALDGTKRPVTTNAGGIAFQLRGVTHIEEGTSDPPLRAVFVELKDDAPGGAIDTAATPPAFPGRAAKQLLDNARVTVWDYAPAIEPHRHTRDAVVVWMEGPTPRARYLARGTVHSDEATGAARATVFELK